MYSPDRQHQPSTTVRHALWLALLIYALVLIFTLFFSADTHAEASFESSKAQLLYDVLGSLEYTDDGKFAPVNDVAGQSSLNELIKQYALERPEASIYILNLSQHILAWSAAEQVKQYDTSTAKADIYDVQVVEDGNIPLLVQNFWVKQTDGSRMEFRMVLVLAKA